MIPFLPALAPLLGGLLARRGLILGVLLAVAAGGLSVAGYGAYRYSKGEKAGVVKDRARSDAVIARMLADAQARLVEAQAREDAKEEAWKLRLKEAQRVHDQDRAALERRAAAERLVAARMRDQLAAYAAGDAAAGPGAAASCGERAAALGDVLGSVLLPALAECARTAEDHAAGVRTLLQGWPAVDSEASWDSRSSGTPSSDSVDTKR